jgi:exopolysaccharide biosynthesis polyprenyl glycosylphosphotransferase
MDRPGTVAERIEGDGSGFVRHEAVDASSDRSHVALLCSDFIGTFVILLLFASEANVSAAGQTKIVGCLVAALVAVATLGMMRAYDPISRLPGARLRMAGHLILSGCSTSLVCGLAIHGIDRPLDAGFVLDAGLVLPVLWISARVVTSIFERSHPARALVIGTGATARHAWELSLRHRECGFEVIGFVDDDALTLPPGAPPTLGRLSDLAALAAEHGVTRVIVAYAGVSDSDLLAVLRALNGRVRVEVIPRLYELVRARGFELGRIALLEAGGVTPDRIDRALKRALDILVATTVLLLAIPLLAAIAIAIKVDSHGPVLFRQRRVGKDGKIFEIFKFRTMVAEAEQSGHAYIQGMPIATAVHELKSHSGETHVTAIGRILRSKSLDELPQLWNVVRGSMSLVGPRPLREYEVAALSEWQIAARQSVRPGITGLWQVSGRSSVSWDERVHLDCAYARHWSLSSDVRILARTIAVVVHRSDTV